LARLELEGANNDYNSFLRSLLNEHHSFEDGNYSPINNVLSEFECKLIVGFLGLEDRKNLSNYKVFGRIRNKNQIFYSDVYDNKHKIQSSVCKWEIPTLNNKIAYGIIHKFIKYKDYNLFIASNFTGNIKITDLNLFDEKYKTIFEFNNISKYFPGFHKYQYGETNKVVGMTDNILATCVMTNLSDSDYSIVTPLIGFEHD